MVSAERALPLFFFLLPLSACMCLCSGMWAGCVHDYSTPDSYLLWHLNISITVALQHFFCSSHQVSMLGLSFACYFCQLLWQLCVLFSFQFLSFFFVSGTSLAIPTPAADIFVAHRSKHCYCCNHLGLILARLEFYCICFYIVKNKHNWLYSLNYFMHFISQKCKTPDRMNWPSKNSKLFSVKDSTP